MKRKMMAIVLSMAMAAALLTGCGGSGSSSAPAETGSTSAGTEDAAGSQDTAEPESSAEQESAAEPAASAAESEAPESTAETEADEGTGNVMDETSADISRISIEAVENSEGKEVRVAALCCPYGPFWKEVVNGIKSAQALLADYNCTVDIIELESLDGQIWYDAISNCIVKDYDVISAMGVSDSICSVVDEAAEAGIKVYFYNSDTAKECARQAFIGQDLYPVAKEAGAIMGELLNGEGEVGIITGLFSINAHELRRTGIEDGLKEKYPNIKLIPAVECQDSDSVAYDVAKDLITANPDIDGICCTANGQIGTAQALEDLGLAGKIKIVCFDYMGQVLDFVENGTIQATISQGPFDQGANPIIYGYNEVITGKPQVEGNAFTDMDVITKDNVADWK